MHKNTGDKSARPERMRRAGNILCLLMLEFLTIILTAWYVSHSWPAAIQMSGKIMANKPLVIHTYASAYFAGIDMAAALLFGTAVYFGTRFCRERDIRHKKEQQNKILIEEDKISKRESSEKSRFLSTMSHEIRTPINAIMGTTQLAIINIHDEKSVEQCLHIIDQASRHMLLLVNDVLDMSRIENGKANVNYSPFSLSDVLDETVAMTKGQLQGRNIEFVREFDNLLNSDLIGDALHLSQVLINILANAVKFTPDGGRIVFRTWENIEPDRVICYFEIADNGIGMSAEFQEHIWEPFAQEMQASVSRQGTGLGLAIVKKYVDLMNGEISVESRQGSGSRFMLSIPFGISRKPDDECMVPAAGIAGMRILLAEDNDLNREVEAELLRTQGVRVDAANNGRMAYEMYAGNEPFHYDAILMDVVMPVMDGIKAARMIRSSGRNDADSIPVIAMTANVFGEDIKEAAEAGMNEHVSKPVDFNKLFETLGRYKK